MSDISEFFELLAHPLRRRLLVQLCVDDAVDIPAGIRTRKVAVPEDRNSRDEAVAGATVDDSDPDVQAESHDRELIELYHVHLPKLESTGVIGWDRDDDTVTRGPAFDRYEPALGVILDNAHKFPPGLV